MLLEKKTRVLAITGDHSTPRAARTFLARPPVCFTRRFPDRTNFSAFTETGANTGRLGVFEAKYLVRLMQANREDV